jgi:segregation and condensation protein B
METRQMDSLELQRIVEALLLASEQPLTMDRILALFDEDQRPSKADLKQALEGLRDSLEGRAVELLEVGSGWRLQTRQDYAGWISRLWEEKPPRYSRALLETLALICYRQPISRAEIEDVRGVGLSQSILKTLLERNWVRVVGYREVPGRPALFGTTKEFLDDFNLRDLESLPTLPEIRDLDALAAALEKLQDSSADVGTPPQDEGDAGSVPDAETLH